MPIGNEVYLNKTPLGIEAPLLYVGLLGVLETPELLNEESGFIVLKL